MQIALLEPRDAMGIAALWLAGAAESAAVDPSFAPRQSLSECTSSIEGELSAMAYFGWGMFEPDSRSMLGYLTARTETPSAVFRRGSVLQLLDLDIQSSVRRKGIGTRLVAAARRYAESHGFDRFEVSWLSADPRASAFWRAQGFGEYIARGQITFRSSEHGA